MRGGLYQCRPASLSPVMPKFSNHCQSSLGNIPVELHTQHGHGPTAPQILWVFPTLSQCVISPKPRGHRSYLLCLWLSFLHLDSKFPFILQVVFSMSVVLVSLITKFDTAHKKAGRIMWEEFTWLHKCSWTWEGAAFHLPMCIFNRWDEDEKELFN